MRPRQEGFGKQRSGNKKPLRSSVTYRQVDAEL